MKLSHDMVLVFILFLFLIPGNYVSAEASTGKKLEAVNLYFRWHHQFQFAGYYAAEKKGFYRQAGLKVTMVERALKKNAIQRVLESPGSFGVSNSSILLHRLHGKPLVVLAAIFQHSPVIFLARKKSGITTPQDLIGKRVLMAENFQGTDAELWATLQNEGISKELIHLVDSSNFTREDYLDESIDALSAYITDEPYFLEDHGIPFSIIKPSTYGIDFYGDCLFTTEHELKMHPERVKAFREASLKGWQYAMKHSEEIIDLILEEYGTTLTRDHLRYEARTMRGLILPEIIEIGHMNPGRWQHIAATFVKLNMVEPGYSLEGFIYNPNPAVDYTWVKWVIGIAILFVLAGALGMYILFSFNKRLQDEMDVRKLVEKNLRIANREALSAVHAKSEFLAKMSHEIRTPMNGVLGMAALLASTPLNREQEEYVEAIRISGRNLLRIINDILDFSKIESGEMEIKEEIFELIPCIEDVFKIVRKEAEEKHIHLRCLIDNGVPAFIKCDITRLKQILINLVNNAVKFMEDGEVLVSVKSHPGINHSIELQFSVKDEGIGIPVDRIEDLFKAFSQLHSLSTSTRKYPGTGLGLAITKQLIQLLGGKIWVESSPGEGSTFFFTLKTPAVFDASQNEPEREIKDKKVSLPDTFKDIELSKPASFNILVAEDNNINRKLIMRILTKMGYDADFSENGFEVLEALEKKNYDLILMDIQMPGMDGVETTKKIIKKFAANPGKRPKIIAITAYAIEGDRERYMEMGMDDYISKPIDITDLREKIIKWSRGGDDL